MIFVDTGAWFARFVEHDADHAAALEWLHSNRQPLVTTEFVIDELVTLLCARKQRAKALEVGEQLLISGSVHIEHVTTGDVAEAWKTFKAFSDKDWSFTDCTSRVVMQRLGIRTAFAFDDDFRQFAQWMLCRHWRHRCSC